MKYYVAYLLAEEKPIFTNLDTVAEPNFSMGLVGSHKIPYQDWCKSDWAKEIPEEFIEAIEAHVLCWKALEGAYEGGLKT